MKTPEKASCGRIQVRRNHLCLASASLGTLLYALAAVPRSYLWVAIHLVSARHHILIHRAASLEHAVLLICLACV